MQDALQADSGRVPPAKRTARCCSLTRYLGPAGIYFSISSPRGGR
jgi:hypothetical protein